MSEKDIKAAKDLLEVRTHAYSARQEEIREGGGGVRKDVTEVDKGTKQQEFAMPRLDLGLGLGLALPATVDLRGRYSTHLTVSYMHSFHFFACYPRRTSSVH